MSLGGVWQLLGWLHLRDYLLWGATWRAALYGFLWWRRDLRVRRGELDQTMGWLKRWRITRYQARPGAIIRLDQGDRP